MAVGEGHEAVAFEEIKDALAQEVHDDADMAAVIEAIPEMDASISVFVVVGLEGRQDPKFYP